MVSIGSSFVLVIILMVSASWFKVLGSSLTASCTNGDALCAAAPKKCVSGSDKFTCTILVTISVNNSSGLNVDIYGPKTAATYYAFGFGPHASMDGLFIVHCDYNANGTMALGEGYATERDFHPITLGTLTESSSTEVQGEAAHCSYKQKKKGSVPGFPVSYDIKNKYYVAVAFGKIVKGSITKHKMKGITKKLIDLKSKGIIDIVVS